MLINTKSWKIYSPQMESNLQHTNLHLNNLLWHILIACNVCWWGSPLSLALPWVQKKTFRWSGKRKWLWAIAAPSSQHSMGHFSVVFVKTKIFYGPFNFSMGHLHRITKLYVANGLGPLSFPNHCIGSFRSNCHTITTTTAPSLFLFIICGVLQRIIILSCCC